MKKTNVLLLALLAFVCLFAVSCDSEPANPANPVNPGKPDDQPVTPPSVFSTKDAELNAYRMVATSLMICGHPFDESISETSDISKLFGGVPGDPNNSEDAEFSLKFLFLMLAFPINSHLDSLADDPYIEVGGEKYYMHELDGAEFKIENHSLGSFSTVFDATSQTRTVIVKDLVYDVVFSSPIVYKMHVDLSAEFEFSMKYDEEDKEWYRDSKGSYSGNMTLNGKAWAPLEFDAVEKKCTYGDYVRSLLCTVTFDTKGGTSIPSQKVFLGDNATEPENPTKEGTLGFMEWRTEDGLRFRFKYDEVFEDMTLYAVYYSNAPAELGGRIYAWTCLPNILDSIENIGSDLNDGKPTAIFKDNAEKNLFDLMLLLVGKVDSYGGTPYIEINGTKYYEADSNYSIKDDGSVEDCFILEVPLESGEEGMGYFANLSYTVQIKDSDGTMHELSLVVDSKYVVSTTAGYEIEVRLSSNGSEEERLPFFKLNTSTGKGSYGEYVFDINDYKSGT